MPTRKVGKRGNGEGSIYQDAEGRWRSVVDLGYRDGKRRRKYLSGQTRAQVASKLRQLLDEQDSGVQITTDGPAPTLEKLAEPLAGNHRGAAAQAQHLDDLPRLCP